jgi:hypothetical protein
MRRAVLHPIKIRALSEMKTCFFNINREVATTILCYFVLVPESIVRLCCGLGLFSHKVKQVLYFLHLHASYLTRF